MIVGLVTLIFVAVVIVLFRAVLQPRVSLDFVSYTNDISGYSNPPFYIWYDTTNAPSTFAVLRLTNHSGESVDFIPLAVRVPSGSNWIEWSVGDPHNQSHKDARSDVALDPGRGFAYLDRGQSITFPLMTPVGTNVWSFSVLVSTAEPRWKYRLYALAGKVGVELPPISGRYITLTAPMMTVTESPGEY
jgi:hypothetical protein